MQPMHKFLGMIFLSPLLGISCSDEVKTGPVAPKGTFDHPGQHNMPADPNSAKKRRTKPGVPIPSDPEEAERFFGWIEKITSTKTEVRNAGVLAVRNANLSRARLKQFLAVAKHYGATAEQLAPLGGR